MNTELIARLDTYATCDDYQRDIEAAVIALKAAQAEIERLKGEEYFYQLHFERACRAKYEALALLAALEQQEPYAARYKRLAAMEAALAPEGKITYYLRNPHELDRLIKLDGIAKEQS